MSDDNHTLLEVSNLIKTYPAESGLLGGLFGGGMRVPALNGVSFRLEAGEILGLIGESGSGKSALARIIAGEEKPDSGKVIFQGKNIAAMSENDVRAIRRHLRYLPEDALTGLTNDPKNRVDRLLSDQPGYSSRTEGQASLQGQALELLQMVGLGRQYLERFPSQMSGGERQRLAIVRALLTGPRLIVADEPVSNLDLQTRTQILNLLKRWARQQGTAFIFISHNPSMVRYFALSGRMGVMFAGRFMEVVPSAGFFDRATHPYTKTLLEANPAPGSGPGAALDPEIARHEIERVDSHALPLDTLEAQLSAEGNMAASAQLAANRPGCPFYRWCPERFERCPQETPQLLTVTKRRDESGQIQPLSSGEIIPEHRAACFWYIDQ